MTWKSERERHSLASNGIKTSEHKLKANGKIKRKRLHPYEKLRQEAWDYYSRCNYVPADEEEIFEYIATEVAENSGLDFDTAYQSVVNYFKRR